ncbi:MAG: UDP-N-acetylglucosamine 2-epimerase [Bacteroides sp.]
MRKICVITGSRAEYGLLAPLMRRIRETEGLQLQVIATCMHLSPEFGLTYREIERDGFFIDKKVEMLLSADTASATAKSVGLGTIGFADAYTDLKPDLLVVLGDRFELLAAVSSALFFKIPVAHLHGGEITEGAYDDSIRHAITKMSHLHFTSTEAYRRRVIALGEQPDRVFYVGAIGIDNLRHLTLMKKSELEESLSFALDGITLLVTFHPVTMEDQTATQQFTALLAALEGLGQEVRVLFTKPNADTDGRPLIGLIDEYVARHPQTSLAFHSLGALRYLSAMQYVAAVVGNSSSGLIEAPSFHCPTVDIGDRQKGRLRAGSVIHCLPTTEAIGKALHTALSPAFKVRAMEATNPYERAHTTDEILNILAAFPLEGLARKQFYDPYPL